MLSSDSAAAPALPPALQRAVHPRASLKARRARDRRTAFADFLAFVAGGLHPDRDARELRLRFEDGVRRLLSVRAVSVMDAAPDPSPEGASNIRILELPGMYEDDRPVLQIVNDARTPPDEWDLQMMHTVGYIAAFVLAIEGRRGIGRARSNGTFALVGSSTLIKDLRQRIARVAASDFTVLIEGESGTGKELVARQIHQFSRRARGAFVPVNCAAIVETLLEAELFGIEERTATGVRGRRGKFESADAGTLFLDEVSDLSMSAQAKLLRAIQDLAVERVGGHGTRRIDTRIVAATNRTLSDLVQDGRFRADLYYRLNGVEIHVPPLRDRREDIPELARYFLERHRALRRLNLSPPAVDALIAYDWPGNVRELERVMERAIVLANDTEIGLEDLPPSVAGSYGAALLPSIVSNESMRTWGSRYARLVLERHGNNKRQACRALGISYHTLRAYLSHKTTAPKVDNGGAQSRAAAAAKG